MALITTGSVDEYGMYAPAVFINSLPVWVGDEVFERAAYAEREANDKLGAMIQKRDRRHVWRR